MKLQLALDAFELDEAVSIMREMADLIQVIEIGTPLILKEGRRAIRRMRREFPNHDILADFKMMDAGDYEAHIAFEAGASIVTVCGAANDATIQNAIRQAEKDGQSVMIDMIEVADFENRIRVLDGFGAKYIQVHTAFDGRGEKSPLSELAIAKKLLKWTKCAVAGGVGRGNILEIAKQKPDLAVLGSKVCLAENRRGELEHIIRMLEGMGHEDA